MTSMKRNIPRDIMYLVYHKGHPTEYAEGEIWIESDPDATSIAWVKSEQELLLLRLAVDVVYEFTLDELLKVIQDIGTDQTPAVVPVAITRRASLVDFDELI